MNYETDRAGVEKTAPSQAETISGGGEMSIFKTLPVTPSLGGNSELQNITAVLQMSICQPGFHQAVDTARLNSSRAHKTHVTTVWNHVYRLCVHVVAVKKNPLKSASQK